MFKSIVLTCFPFLLLTFSGVAQERKFADASFQFTEVTYPLYLQELQRLENQPASNDLSHFFASLSFLERELINGEIPLDFKFLSFYNKYTQSPIKQKILPTGVYWCFTEFSAQELNLKVNQDIDERKHLTIATQKAINKIQYLFAQNSSWGITLFASIASPEFTKALDLEHKWKDKIIVLDSPSYKTIIDFLAFMTYTEQEYHKVFSTQNKLLYVYQSADGQSLQAIAEHLQIPIEEIKSSNLWLNTINVVPKNYSLILYLPANRYYEIKNLDHKNSSINDLDFAFPVLIPNQNLQKGLGGTFYSINQLPGIQAEMGDRFINLAYKAKLSPDKFLRFNDLHANDPIQPGEIYYLSQKNKKAAIPFHIAAENETLWDISQKYAVKLDGLLKYNRLEKITRLIPGQIIWMREKRPSNQPIQYIPIDKEIKEDVQEDTRPINPLTAISENKIPNHLEENIVLVKPQLDISKSQETLNENPDGPKKFQVHEVKDNETLQYISEYYQVSIRKLKQLNNLLSNKIELGDKLIIREN